MEPLTKIELGTCKWLGVLAITCTVAAELLSLATDGRGAFTARETLRRSLRQARIR